MHHRQPPSRWKMVMHAPSMRMNQLPLRDRRQLSGSLQISTELHRPPGETVEQVGQRLGG